MNTEIISKLEGIVGKEWVMTKLDEIENYLRDETEKTVRPKPAERVVVVKPGSAQEISEILKLANELKVPVFPRGAGTGLVGGAIPTKDGIVISLERLNKILEIDTENMMAVVEAGVPFSKIDEEAAKHGLSFPPHPGDETATIGGNIACNAGGARCVKYGVVRDYVKGLEVVLPTGEIVTYGGKLLKNATGYDLMQLFIGSQGTLGIITKAILRLRPRPKADATLIVSFKNRYDAVKSVPLILQQGVTPLGIEYVEREAVEKAVKEIGFGRKWPEGEAFLIIIVAENSQEEVYAVAEKIDEICRKCGAHETLIEEGKRQQKAILDVRSKIGETTEYTLDVLDVSVPPANMAKLLDELEKLAKKYGIVLPAYGHVGDGNLHPHILDERAGGIRREDLEKISYEIYDIVVSLGGVISGEHGIGRIRKKYLPKYLSKKQLEDMRKIKELFDPNNILNPGNIL
ncbi:MAG: FAD-binding oxidoreductase [Candidatus Bathyarchaeia archaeon]